MFSSTPLHKTFISYHHANDQRYKDYIVRKFNGISFIDQSVDTHDIDDRLSDDSIRTLIRDNYLRDSTVTIVLAGSETKHRKHVDWEIYSSMYNGSINRKSGIIVVNLPSISQIQITHSKKEKELIRPYNSWSYISDYTGLLIGIPIRIIDNLRNNVPITIVNYNTIMNNPYVFREMIHIAFSRRFTNNYTLLRPMRKRNN